MPESGIANPKIQTLANIPHALNANSNSICLHGPIAGYLGVTFYRKYVYVVLTQACPSSAICFFWWEADRGAKAGHGTLSIISRTIFNQSVCENVSTHCTSGN